MAITTINISGQDVNKPRINIYAPAGIRAVGGGGCFHGSSEIREPSHYCELCVSRALMNGFGL